MSKKCLNCQADLDDTVQFCPNCGTKAEIRKDWVCETCQTVNDSTANFCKGCGSSIHPTEKTFFQKCFSSQYAKYGLGLFLVMVIAALGSYYYFNFVSENHYLAQYAEISRKVETTNDLLTSSIKADSLTSDKITSLQKDLQEQKNQIDNIEKDFSHSRPMQKYENQHKNLLNLLNKESSMLEEVSLIIKKPLDTGSDDILSSLRNNIDETKSLAEQIQVPNANFAINNDMSTLPHQLSLFVEEQRRINKDKLDRLASMNNFFQKVDNIIQRYDGAKTDLSGLLGNLRNGGYTWFDYFKVLQQARSFRLGIRSEIDRLNAPKGTENLKRAFSEVLTASLQYCDQMNAAAQIEFQYGLPAAQKKYSEAKTINSKVQDSYTNFISDYQSEKARLTDINNL